MNTVSIGQSVTFESTEDGRSYTGVVEKIKSSYAVVRYMFEDLYESRETVRFGSLR